jgi:hypothetical protein
LHLDEMLAADGSTEVAEEEQDRRLLAPEVREPDDATVARRERGVRSGLADGDHALAIARRTANGKRPPAARRSTPSRSPPAAQRWPANANTPSADDVELRAQQCPRTMEPRLHRGLGTEDRGVEGLPIGVCRKMKALQTVYSLPVGEMEAIQTLNWPYRTEEGGVTDADIVFSQK